MSYLDRYDKKKIRCPRCRGLGEIMKREKSVDTDGSEDIGNTPYVSVCPRCLGECEIDLGKPKFYSNRMVSEKIK